MNQKPNVKCDAEFTKTQRILIESLVKILKTTDNLVFKYSILAKLNLNHLSNDAEIDKTLSKLLENFIDLNINKVKKSNEDEEFDQLDIKNEKNYVADVEKSPNVSSFLSQNSIKSEFNDLIKFEPIFHNEECKPSKKRIAADEFATEEEDDDDDDFDLLEDLISKHKSRKLNDHDALNDF